MNKRFLAALAALFTAVGACSCGSKDSSSSESSSEVQATEAVTENTTEVMTDEVTEETTKEPPVPAEASDPNTVTFDNGDFSFAKVINDDGHSAVGELSVAELAGNKMLKFTDDFSVPIEGKVQKVSISVLPLIGKENLSKVRSIEFDFYADAVAQEYTDENGELKQVPGTICGGGGTATAAIDSEGKGKWYGFSDFEGGEYDFDYSGPLHQEFKFLLADSGQCWSEEMEDPNFLIMRWGSENKSNIYIDNIVFYDENGNSIPILSGDNAANE